MEKDSYDIYLRSQASFFVDEPKVINNNSSVYEIEKGI